jgi:hypothetical protein
MKPIFNGHVAYLVFLTLFLTIGSSPIFAVDCLKLPNHPHCPETPPPPPPDPDPGDETLSLENVTGWWSGLVEDQADGTLWKGRECEASGSVSQGYVAYGCGWEKQVHFILPTPNDGDTIGKEAELCSQLGGFTIGEGGSNVIEFDGSTVNTGPGRITAYHFTMDPTWNDGKCVDENSTCLVRVRITAYFDSWCNAKKCGRLMLVRGWGRAEPAGVVGGLIELNPFYYNQEIDIHDLEIHFMGIGTNRDVAECHWYDSGVQYNTDNPYR